MEGSSVLSCTISLYIGIQISMFFIGYMSEHRPNENNINFLKKYIFIKPQIWGYRVKFNNKCRKK